MNETRCASRPVRIKFVCRHTAGFHYAGTGDPRSQKIEISAQLPFRYRKMSKYFRLISWVFLSVAQTIPHVQTLHTRHTRQSQSSSLSNYHTRPYEKSQTKWQTGRKTFSSWGKKNHDGKEIDENDRDAAGGADYNNKRTFPSKADHQNGARDVRNPSKLLPKSGM